jgi:hypothetical protein
MSISDQLAVLWQPVFGLAWDHGPIVAFFTAFAASWGMMNLLAIVLERRILLPSQQYASFYKGDVWGLSVMVAALNAMARFLPRGGTAWYQATWWHALWLIIGFLVGMGYLVMEYKRGAYSLAQIFSPTKIYHNPVLFPIMFYWLIANGVPIMLYSRLGPRGILEGNWVGILPLVVFIAAASYWAKLIWTDMKSDASDKQAHVAITAREMVAALSGAILLTVAVVWAPRSQLVSGLLTFGSFLAGLGYYGVLLLCDTSLSPGIKPWAHIPYRWSYLLPWKRTPWPFWTAHLEVVPIL